MVGNIVLKTLRTVIPNLCKLICMEAFQNIFFSNLDPLVREREEVKVCNGKYNFKKSISTRFVHISFPHLPGL